MNIQPFPFIAVAGTPHARGRQYGQQAADRVRASAALYGRALDKLGMSGADRRALIRRFAKSIEDFGAHYVEEMRGIAEGANVEFEDVVMINARTEVVAQARGDGAAARGEAARDGCTGALILPSRSATGHLIHGQNWDWRSECADTAIVLRVRPEHGPDILTFVEAGGLARSGFNGAGVSITANYLESDRDFTQSGVPLSLIRRKVLEQEHFALAIQAVATTPKSCSNNIMLGMAQGFGIDFECTTDEAFPIYPDAQDLIVHANHWGSPVALAKLRDTGRGNAPDSPYRDWRVRRMLAGDRPLTREHLRAALSDTFGTPYSVCRPPRPGARDYQSATVAMILMEPAAGEMDVTPLPALNRMGMRYSLNGEPRPLADA